ncbi:AraC-like DNA-binding protein [Rhizobium laguerreae]|uniref:AraC-like DNA-binding protein n=1 Tax=Rhizobium laguerreae TaxID=1076926 RepID=A0ABR6G1E5_9HYPH|nr:AraC-like DNA-binding protein [Rhizobium laguerreae]
MNGDTAWALYENRLRRVSAYIHDHLDEELDMERLAEIACMSTYHWHRIYRAIYGETLAATVKRLRLHRAAGEIVRTELAVSEIAKRSGYPQSPIFQSYLQVGLRHAAGPLSERGKPHSLRTLT